MRLHVNVDKTRGKKYIYQQIYEAMKDRILTRKLRANEKLPSKRQLAEDLHVSINSVMNAYDQLLAEGYIYSIERSGYYVENITPFIRNEDMKNKTLSSDLSERRINKDGWLSLSHMTADITKFPFKTWLKYQQKAIDNHKRELAEISHPQGPYIVRQTIAQMIALTRGVICEPEQIVIGAGTQPLIQRLMEMKKRNTTIALEDPGYARFYTLLKQIHFHVKPIVLDEKGIDIEKLESSKADVVIVTPSHQFPTGMIMPISRRIELLNWAAKSSERYIVEDDYDSEFKYETDSIPSLQSLDKNHQVIYTGTFSKTLLPSFRISYIVLPPHVLREYHKNYAYLIQGSNSLNLFTLHYFIQSGEYAKHIKRMNHFYEMKRKILIKQLKNRFEDKIEISDIPAGLHFLARFFSRKSYAEIAKRAEEEKLEIYLMTRFMLENTYKEANTIEIIIGFANIKEKDIAEAVERLYRIVIS